MSQMFYLFFLGHFTACTFYIFSGDTFHTAREQEEVYVCPRVQYQFPMHLLISLKPYPAAA